MILCGQEVEQDTRFFPLTRDSVLLAHFAAVRTGVRVLDLGAGPGWLGILLQERTRCTVDGLERDPDAAETAMENYRRAACAGTVRAGDWKQLDALPPGAYDLCVSNPPYFDENAGPAGGPRGARQAGREEPAALCAAAGRALKNGGRFCLCFPPARAVDFLCALRGAGLEPKRLRDVCRRAAAPPALMLLEAKKGGRPGLRVLAPLVTETRAGLPTAELKAIYGGTT